MENNMSYGRYNRGQMMPRVMDGCETCGNARMMKSGKDCDDCNYRQDELSGMPLAMSYVPWHKFECTYEAAQALKVGTIFPELDKPFYGRRGMR